jgi:hypothetical protein
MRAAPRPALRALPRSTPAALPRSIPAALRRASLPFVAGGLLAGAAGGCLGLDLETPSAGCASNSECAPGLLCDATTRACVPESDNALSGDFTCDVNADPATFPGSEVLGRVGEEHAFFAQGATCEIENGQLTVAVLQPSRDRQLYAVVALSAGRLQYPLAAPTEAYLTPTPNAGRAMVFDADEAIEAFASSGTLSFVETPAAGVKLRGRIGVSLAKPSAASSVGRPCPGGVTSCGPDPSSLCAARDATPICYQSCADGSPCPQGTACLEGACLVPCQSQAACPAGLVCNPTDVVGEGACY